MEIAKLNANSVEFDQTPHSVMSDLGLHCLLMSFIWDARQKRVKRHKVPQNLAYVR